jgi:hypothetical protein
MRRILSLLFILGWTAGPASAEPVGFFATLVGDVQVTSKLAPNVDSWQAARQDGPLEIGDRIRTGLGGSARIVLVDDTMLHIDEDTELRIESFHVGAAATQERSVLRQTRGRLRTIVGDAFGGSTRIEVHTPTAVVGVKGTDLETADDPTQGRVRWRACCHAGAIQVSNPAGSASPPPGHCVYAEEGLAPGPIFPNPSAPYQASAPRIADEDFTEELARSPRLPGDDDEPRDDDDLRVFDVPEQAPAAPAQPINPPVLFLVAPQG